MADNIQFNTEPDQDTFVLRSKKMDLDAGWLGRCFGASNNAPLNIAGLMMVLLVGSGVAVLFLPSSIPASDYWKIIVPLLTLVMGYVFGKGSHGN
jgi:hypothetical protein